jgi:small subunit ribosomal protein S2
MFEETIKYVKTLAANKGRILFVATKRQAREIIKEEAIRADCAYVNHRWLGGMLTNFKTVKQSIKRLNELQLSLEDGSIDKITKKEALGIKKEYDKLERSIGGIKNMNSLPDAIFVIDVGYESGAVVEATKLGIPIMGVVDTNNSIDDIAYVIPGNDDSSRAIRLYARGIADAVLEGKKNAIDELAKMVKEEAAEKDEPTTEKDNK